MTDEDRAPLARLAAAGALALLVRLTIVFALPDADTDAYGHFHIARVLVAAPENLVAHWVWLPAYHYALSLLVRLGLGFTGARVLSALLQAAAPFLLFDLVRRRDPGPSESRRVAELAALAFTLAPLPNVMATSAQQETVFALLVLAAVWSLDRRRAALAGGLLAGACLVRYEAWGGVAALAAWIAWRALRRRERPGLASVALPALAVAAWLTARHRVDGEWLLFLRQTREFAGGVRGTSGLSPLLDASWFPVVLPFAVLGPALVLVPVGLRRAWRPSFVVPAGILAFLFASYAGRGALGLARYYTALVPFACVALAEGALVVAARWKKPPRKVAAIAVALLGLTTAAHLRVLVGRSTARAEELRGYQEKAERDPAR